MTNQSRGEVAINLDGAERVLKPSLMAFTALGSYENYSKLLGLIAAGNLAAILAVLRYGLGLDEAETKKLPGKVFRTGIMNLTDPLADYVYRLFNAGMSLDEALAARGGEARDEGALVPSVAAETESPLAK